MVKDIVVWYDSGSQNRGCDIRVSGGNVLLLLEGLQSSVRQASRKVPRRRKNSERRTLTHGTHAIGPTVSGDDRIAPR